jgi:hypothetical protein
MRALFALLILAALSSPLAAQRAPWSEPGDLALHLAGLSQDPPRPRSEEAIVALGAAAGVLGALVGGAVGYEMASGCTGWFCEVPGTLLVGGIGMSLGSSLAVHHLSGGHGSWPGETAAAAGVLLVGFVVAGAAEQAVGDPGLLVLAVVPLAQSLVTRGMERRAERRRR